MYNPQNHQKIVNQYSRRKDTTGRRLAYLMQKKGLTKYGFAKRCAEVGAEYGIKFTYNDIAHYLEERCQPKSDKLYVISLAMHVSTQWILGFEGNRVNLKPFTNERP